jgi:uncharacterized protein YwgA
LAFDEARFRRLALLSLIFQAAGSVVGRTKLQKIAYLANLCGWKALDFTYHNYGPYSQTLFAEIENLQGIGWIKEEPVGTTRDGDVLLRYSFAPEQRVRRDSFITKFRDLHPENTKLVRNTRELVEGLAEKSSEELEIMATLMYLREGNPSLTDERLVELALQLKPYYDRKKFQEGLIVFRMMKHYLPESVRAKQR